MESRGLQAYERVLNSCPFVANTFHHDSNTGGFSSHTRMISTIRNFSGFFPEASRA
jgi:hypothetical protein